MDPLDANDAPGRYPASYWAASARPPPPRPALEGAARADVAILGGGYTGLSAALHLAERGVDVALLEAHRIGFGASGRNGGQVASLPRGAPETLAARHGKARAKALFDLAAEARALVEDLILKHAIACDFRKGAIHADHRARFVAETHGEAEQLARDFGYDQIEPLDRDGVRALVRSDAYFGGWLDHGAAHLHPLNYALGLAAAAERAGARLYEGARVNALKRDAKPRLLTDQGALEADAVLLAGNGYLTAIAPEIESRVAPINNFVVATEPLEEAPIARDHCVSDSRFVVDYFKMSADGRLIFGGGESYGARFPADIAKTVRGPLRRIFPELADKPLPFAWGGTLAITPSRTPYFLRLAPSILAASGYSGQGVAFATLGGKIVAEALTGAPDRFDFLASLAPPPFPGGRALRAPLLALAMRWFAFRDEI